MFDEWLMVLAMGWLVVVVPGPNFAMTLRNSLTRSRRAGLFTAFGVSLGGVGHVTYSLIGIGLLISQSIFLFNTLKRLGALYLIYLGIRALLARKHDHSGPQHTTAAPLDDLAALRMGFLTCILNPKATLFFFSLFTQVIRPGTPLPTQALYGLTIVACELTWYTFVALASSHRAIRGIFDTALHWVERATGVLMIGFGLRLALARLDPGK
jgi:RhtB (resistance to homoserine/threonine) family protein